MPPFGGSLKKFKNGNRKRSKTFKLRATRKRKSPLTMEEHGRQFDVLHLMSRRKYSSSLTSIPAYKDKKVKKMKKNKRNKLMASFSALTLHVDTEWRKERKPVDEYQKEWPGLCLLRYLPTKKGSSDPLMPPFGGSLDRYIFVVGANNYNPAVMTCVRSNHDVKFIPSGKDGRNIA